MKVIIILFLVATLLYGKSKAKTLKVFHNPFDPTDYTQRPKGGAQHIGKGDGNVDALTICVRFQVSSIIGHPRFNTHRYSALSSRHPLGFLGVVSVGQDRS